MPSRTRGVPPAYAEFGAEPRPGRYLAALARRSMQGERSSTSSICETMTVSDRPSGAARDGRARWRTHHPLRCRSAKTKLCWASSRLPPGGAAVLRQADRAAGELRRAGGDRDGERAADHRTARGAGAADRDRRGVAGDQCLARRSGAGVRCDAGKGDAAVRRSVRRCYTSTTESASVPWRRVACPPHSPSICTSNAPPARSRDRLRPRHAWKRTRSRCRCDGGRALPYRRPFAVAAVELGGIRTILIVPLLQR